MDSASRPLHRFGLIAAVSNVARTCPSSSARSRRRPTPSPISSSFGSTCPHGSAAGGLPGVRAHTVSAAPTSAPPPRLGISDWLNERPESLHHQLTGNMSPSSARTRIACSPDREVKRAGVARFDPLRPLAISSQRLDTTPSWSSKPGGVELPVRPPARRSRSAVGMNGYFDWERYVFGASLVHGR